MTDYEMALFDRYHISVEFERQMGCVRRGMYAYWPQVEAVDEEDLAVGYPACISPLEIFPEHAQLNKGWGEQSNRFFLNVPYRGDYALWHLYPSDIVTGLMGEPCRGNLILVHSGGTAVEARAEFDHRLSAISSVIRQQIDRIRRFEAAVPYLVKREAQHIRAEKSRKHLSDSALQKLTR